MSREGRPGRDLPSALGLTDPTAGRAFLFFDYDGTLAPIAPVPDMAELPPEVRAALVRLSERWPVAIISGRDLRDVRDLVGLPNLVYAGCHGLEIAGPDGWHEERGTEAAAALDRAERALRDASAVIPGVVVERKRYGLAVHYRLVAPERLEEVERAVARAAADAPDLRRASGKAVFELRPAVAWTKGDAVRRILQIMDPLGSRTPIYLGDDDTDEDAFAAVVGFPGGIAIAVGPRSADTAASHRLQSPAEVLDFMRTFGASVPSA